MYHLGTRKMENKVEVCKIQELELILKSINYENYKSKYENHGINEHTVIQLSADDRVNLNDDNKNIYTILNAINILNTTLMYSEIQLTNYEMLKLHSNICLPLGYITLILNHIHKSITSDKKILNDKFIDNHTSTLTH